MIQFDVVSESLCLIGYVLAGQNLDQHHQEQADKQYDRCPVPRQWLPLYGYGAHQG